MKLMEVPTVCAVCRSKGFEPSKTGVGCEFCDGTWSGNPPQQQLPSRVQSGREKLGGTF